MLVRSRSHLHLHRTLDTCESNHCRAILIPPPAYLNGTYITLEENKKWWYVWNNSYQVKISENTSSEGQLGNRSIPAGRMKGSVVSPIFIINKSMVESNSIQEKQKRQFSFFYLSTEQTTSKNPYCRFINLHLKDYLLVH